MKRPRQSDIKRSCQQEKVIEWQRDWLRERDFGPLSPAKERTDRLEGRVTREKSMEGDEAFKLVESSLKTSNRKQIGDMASVAAARQQSEVGSGFSSLETFV